MRSRTRAWCVGVAVGAGIASLFSCSKSFEPGDETGGASGSAGTDEHGGSSGAATGGGGRGGSSGASTGGAVGTGGTAAAAGEAGAGPEPTGGTGNGGTGGAEPEGGTGGGTGGATYRSVVMADEPLAYWRMGITDGVSVPNEMGGDNALVLQGSGHELGLDAAIRDDTDHSMGFDGIASFAIATDPREFDFTERAPFTLECWARRTTGGGGYFQHLFSNIVGSPGTRDGYVLYLLPEPEPASGDNQRSSLEYDRPGVEVPLWGPVPDADTWAHYAATFDGANAKLYVNGTLESTQPIDAGFAARTGPFAVGRAANDNRDYFKGTFDELAVYPRALSVGEIAEHFSYRVR